MAGDSRAELRAIIAEQLSRFWPPSSAVTKSEYSDRAVDDITDPGNTLEDLATAHAQSNQLREEVANEIASMLRGTKPNTEFIDQDPEANVPTVSSLPLGARLKPRGVFEDDWTTRPCPKRPWPVILLHGTCDTKGMWQYLGTELREDGWAVFAPDYGTRATGLIPTSAKQIGAYIDAVLTITGASKVIIIGHSQGGLLARYWMRHLDGARKVRHLVCLGSPNHGTTAGGIISPLVATKRAELIMHSVISSWFGPAGEQQLAGHPLIESINKNGDLEDGVTYTCIATKSDTVIRPPESCFLDSRDVPDGTVRNIYVQDFDRLAVVLHEDMPTDKRVRVIVRTVLKQL